MRKKLNDGTLRPRPGLYVTFLDLKMERGPSAITWLRFPGVRLVEQTESKVFRI